MTIDAGDHWPGLALRWSQIGPPLRPSPADVAAYAEAIGRWSSAHGVPRALILGVTPELFHLRWPAGTDLMAVDHTRAMIDHVWPGPRDAAILADWHELPLPDASRDIVLCDGGLQLLSYPDGQRELVRSLARVIAPGGIFVLRLFAPPTRAESPRGVLDDLVAGRIPDVNVLKVRLGTAMQRDARSGVRPSDIWAAIISFIPDVDALARRLTWTEDHVASIRVYKDSAARYHFVTIDEMTDLFRDDPGGFTIESVHTSADVSGIRFPTIALRRLDSAPANSE